MEKIIWYVSICLFSGNETQCFFAKIKEKNLLKFLNKEKELKAVNPKILNVFKARNFYHDQLALHRHRCQLLR